MSRRFIRHARGIGQRGFAVAYMIAAISLLSLVGWVGSQMLDANAEVRWISTTTDVVFDQVQLIRKQVLACGANYPAGDNGDASSLSHYRKYPGSNVDLAAITCPGAPAAEQVVWSGRHGIFLRKLPNDFAAWSYSNTAAGISVSVRATSSRSITVGNRLAARLGSAEGRMVGDTFTFVVAAP